MELIPVILSGGVGSRLWPVSRETHPKPFMTLPDGHTLIQKAFLRAAGLVQVAEVLTVTNRGLLFKTEDEYRSVNSSELPLGYILEPFGRNTACAVAAAALRLQQSHGPQAYMLILAADHLIQKDDAFRDAVAKAISLASEGWLVTFGVTPRYPETGFGYIETASEVVGAGLKVERFVEKPDLQNVKSYLATGNYFWNTGMFCFQVGTVLEEFKQHAPDVLEAVERTLSLSRSSRASGYACLVLDSEQFAQARDISIDYALMERSSKVATVPCDLEWSDIGSWNAVSELTGADEHDDRFEGEVMAYAASNNYVHTEDRLAALVDVQDPLVVDTQDALLIAHKDRAQEVKHIVTRLKREGHAAHLMHRTVHRPRGTYATLEECERFKIKRIVVKPKASLSLQLHHHRSEHWIVVSGLAVVINDDRELILNTNESTYIRAGNQHRLQNPGVIDLVIIEVQSGEYLGEDDIVRFEDNYGRCGS